ncbi:bifunctional DNA primase/polymerase [Pseudofrankia asymbiotica]|uniref:DNA primase/polymerase bifunctional N-terminal domain-containing protein n=1 Tax=Pseudofrankia asymbiotica TaxID=1834516 RepID=A0A1V2IKK0_9ACTN|nr:bifunctional DNA primase/polymerase [Pseudofrankia asymbiotica]ONH33637.1 hypothetical protein BL253_01060 [Pseudofrankia asymbiotica]
MSTEMRAAALTLAARGCHVFPVLTGTKQPLVKWGTTEPATTDPSVITFWWSTWPRASVGVATGPSGLVVVDLDGDEGVASWLSLVAEHGQVPTATVATGRGHHLWFLAGDGPELRNSSKLVAPGIDVRAVGGYVIAPPSWHRTGVRYRWENDDQPAPLPAWVRALATPPAPEPRPAAPRFRPASGSGTAAPDRILAGLVQVVMDAAEGTRNDRLYWAARRVAEHAGAGRLDLETGADALLSAAAAVGLPAFEAERTVQSGLRHLGAA